MTTTQEPEQEARPPCNCGPCQREAAAKAGPIPYLRRQVAELAFDALDESQRSRGLEPCHTGSDADAIAAAVVGLVQPELESLAAQVEQQHEINAGWVAYGERVKGQRRKYADDLAAAIGYDQQRWVSVEGMIPLVAQRTKSLTDEIERLGKAVASWQDLWQSKEEWEQAATESWTKSDALSGLLRGMARRVVEWRRKYRSLSRSYVRLGAERDEKQFEVERLRRQLERAGEFPLETAERKDQAAGGESGGQ
jgi:hypothetical protein